MLTYLTFPSVHCVQKFFLRDFINNGNRTEWSPIHTSVTKSDNREAGVRFIVCNHVHYYRLNWTTRSPVTN